MNDVLLAGLWQGALITAVSAALTLFVSRRNAATRHAMWFSALIALAILPLLVLWHPAPVLPLPIATTVVVASAVTGRAAIAGGLVLFVLWLTGVAWCALRLGISFIRIARIVRKATPAPHLGPEVHLTDELAMPIATGMVRGRILIPVSLAQALEPDELRAIVAHERAHILRRDIAANFVQRCIEALLFFNPWVYVIGSAIVREREAACDDRAIAGGAVAERYASCLARLARDPRLPRTPLLTPSAIGGRRTLVARIARLLNGKAMQLKVNYFAVTGAIVAFAFLAVALQAPNAIAIASPPAQATINGHFPPNCYHDASVLNPAAPNISRGDYRPNVWANALVTVSSTGAVVSVKIVKSSGSAGIDRATIDAATRSTYRPAMNGCNNAVTGQYLFHVQTGAPQP